MTDKMKYIQWAATADLPFFFQPWWLDCVCHSNGKTWEVVIETTNNDIVAAFVFQKWTKYGLIGFILPELTPFLGFYFKQNLTEKEKQQYAKKIISKIENQKFNFLQIACFTDILPHNYIDNKKFHFNQRTTYRIPDISDINALKHSFHHSKQRHIRKAEKQLVTDFSLSVEDFCKLHIFQFQSQNKKDFFSFDFLCHICQTAIQNQQGKIIAIKDKQENIHAAIFAVWDKHCAYNLLYFIHPQYRSSGASSLMILEMLKFLHGKTQCFDFEGSEKKEIAESYQKFATEPYNYYVIEKINFPLLKIFLSWYKKLKEFH